jgi:hypothetical protein
MSMMKSPQIVAFGVALVQGLNGLAMVAGPRAWYDLTPGVAASGPFNPHFVADVGLAYLAAAGALAVGALRSSRPLAIAGAAWPIAHSGLHVVTWFRHGLPSGPALWSEAVGVLAVSLLGLGAALRISNMSAASCDG